MSVNNPPSPIVMSSALSMIRAMIRAVFDRLERVPYWILALPLRLAVAMVFWNSAMSHLANWQTTLYLFENDYRLPFLPPHPAAYMAVTMELVTPWLLIAGLFTRLTSLALLGMTTVIEVFVYPQAWPTHIQWAAMLLVLLCRGPGAVSLDRLIKRYVFPRG